MGINNPYSSFADPNSFWGQPILPRIGQAFSDMFSSMGRSMGNVPPTPAGIRPIPKEASIPNPVPFLQSLNPLANTPLIGGVAQGRRPMQEPPTPPTTVLPSGTPMVGFDSYPTTPQSTVFRGPNVAGANPRAATQDDIDYMYRRGAYGPAGQTPPAAVAEAAPLPASPYSEKVPIQTPYGTIYATPEQASRKRVAEIATMPRDGARLARIGEQARRAARIKQVRATAAETFRKQELERQEAYNVAQNKKREEREEAARQRALREVEGPSRSDIRRRARAEGTQTTQRSWSNYTGPNPIRRRRGTDFYKDSSIYS